MAKRTYRKLATTSLAVAAVSAVAPVVSAAEFNGYPDVPTDHSHYDGIKELTIQGVVQGYPDGKFYPFKDLSREHAAIFFTKALNLSIPSDVDSVLSKFSDVDKDSLYAGHIAAVTKAGIFNGSGGAFHPDSKLTREQMATVLVLALDLEAYNPTTNVDIKLDNVSASHKKNVQILANLGLTNQLEDFRPNEAISRGAFSTFLYKAQQVVDQHYKLSIMHTNDTHAHLDNVAKVATAVKEVRAEKPDSLLLSAGDVFSGTLYFNEYQGQADLAFMNLLGYDAMTFGNHEFDLGSSAEGHKGLADFVNGAEFPFVSSNVDFSADTNMAPLSPDTLTSAPEDGKIYNAIIKEVNGEKIGMIGLTTEETADLSSPEDVKFEPYLQAARDAVASLEAEGVNKIVAITHIGYDDNPQVDNDQELAKVDGIDVIVGGHSHTELSEPVFVPGSTNDEPTVIVQAYQYHNALGTLDVTFDEEGLLTGYAGELIEIDEQKEDPEAAELLKQYSTKIEELMNKESGGVAAEALPNPRLGDGDAVSVRNSETALGNLIADGMLAKAKTFNPNVVLAVQNGGGIRTSIDKGPITLGEILTVLPFGNTLATIDLTGAELKQALEHSVSEAPNESGGFLHTSGMKFTYDSSKPAGERVQSVMVMQGDSYVELDPAANYTIATNAFTAKGGDGYDVFAKAYEEGRVTDLGVADWENLRDHVANLGTVDPAIEGRITDIAAK
ncbi:5'-nucleotidase C-terminal domain-containing protein [Radiobacillus deserti]|uniref:Bifunctional metallophosphatase/5'-nucleotidase n=1 Tax=Radiobacillus deserti TaxID=2594883 RepID=A0A516KJE0_9BACI|nr:5'-nucleotidase C-terminal domain-containing protein [Radiobacillus deserti]QDP41514.1 bifunctional metallophosphatase/5'-nucleotidase [Radiobacillus deserti]